MSVQTSVQKFVSRKQAKTELTTNEVFNPVMYAQNATINAEISIYIPTMTQDNEDTADIHGFVVRYVLREFSKMFGGATAFSAQGAYILKDNRLQVENVTVVYSAFKIPVSAKETEQHNANLANVEQIAQSVKGFLNQESVLVTIKPLIMGMFV